MKFSNMKLGTKLISAFVLVCLIGAVVSGIGIRNMARINDEGDKVYHLDLIGLSLTQRADVDLLTAGRALRNAILASSSEQRAGFLADSEKSLAQAREALDKARPLYWSAKGKDVFAELDQGWRDYSEAFRDMETKTGTASLQDRGELTEKLFGDFRQKVNKVDELITTLVDVKQENAKEAAESNQDLYVESRNLMIALVIIRPRRDTGHDAVTWMLTRGDEPHGLAVAKMRILNLEPRPELRVHPGYEWFTVLSGAIRLQLGERVIRVEAGQAAQFSTMAPHAISAVDHPAEVITIFDRDGRRAHLDATPLTDG